MQLTANEITTMYVVFISDGRVRAENDFVRECLRALFCEDLKFSIIFMELKHKKVSSVVRSNVAFSSCAQTKQAILSSVSKDKMIVLSVNSCLEVRPTMSTRSGDC